MDKLPLNESGISLDYELTKEDIDDLNTVFIYARRNIVDDEKLLIQQIQFKQYFFAKLEKLIKNNPEKEVKIKH